MMHFNFIASDNFSPGTLKSVEHFVNAYPDFQTVVLKDERELQKLLQSMGMNNVFSQETNTQNFTKYWDLSNFRFPEMNSQQYDTFYRDLIRKLDREDNMNEYGNLIFLQGMSSKWNKLKYRIVVKEEQ